MARINIDSKFRADARVAFVVSQLNEQRRTIYGSFLLLWSHCYELKTNKILKKLVDAVSEQPGFGEALVQADLASVDDDYLIIKGIESRIQYLNKDFSSMGKASAEARRKKLGSAQPNGGKQTWKSNTNRTRIELDSNTNRTRIEPSSSSSSSSSNKTYSSSGDDVCVKFMQLWNENCRPLPTIKSLTDKRRKKIKSRLADHPDLDYWVLVVKRIAASNFCRGEVNGSTWRADFDFLLKPDTHVVTMEGRYDNRSDSEPSHSRYQTINPNEYTDD